MLWSSWHGGVWSWVGLDAPRGLSNLIDSVMGLEGKATVSALLVGVRG